MFQTLSEFSTILSLTVGCFVGLILYTVSGKPRTEKGVYKILTGMLFAPIIGKNLYLFGNLKTNGELEGIVIAPLLFGILGSLVICYIVHNLKTKSIREQ